eukprot:gene3523-7805_t
MVDQLEFLLLSRLTGDQVRRLLFFPSQHPQRRAQAVFLAMLYAEDAGKDGGPLHGK